MRTACAGLLVFAVILLAACNAPVSSPAEEDAALGIATGDARVDALLRRMTLAEKIGLIHGVPEPAATDQGQAGYWAGLPRLGIPPLRLADGPPGVLTRVPSTGMTATMGLAATFSRTDAHDNGMVIGRDARALGVQVVLQPYINLFRDQTFARAYNTYGEDPFLTGQIAAAQILGTQSQGVMAQAKHFIGYDGADDVVIEDQALHEIYAAPFDAAIRAGVSSLMCSYNHIDGPYSCGNPQTLTHLLRDQLAFQGFVTSDWGATHASGFINAGLDLEMPGPSTRTGIPDFFAGRMLAAAVTGQVSEATVTRAVAHILLQLDRFGYLQHPPSLSVTAEPVDDDERIVQKTAEDAAVLLKNNGVLPLNGGNLRSVALIGPGAGQTVAIGIAGEKALGFLSRQVSPYKALQQLLGHSGAHLTYSVADDMTGVPVPASQLSHGGQPGLARADGRVDPVVSFTIAQGTALPAGTQHTWRGTLTAPQAGRYYLSLELLGALGTLRVDGREVGATDSLFLHGRVLQPNQDNVLPTVDGLDNVRRALLLTAGPHALQIDVHADASGQPEQVRLAWSTPAHQRALHAAAVTAARAARVAVVFAWSQGTPAFALPADQNQLIADVAGVNPHTVVVLNVSRPIEMPWLSRVAAVLQMWYPGDEGGPATARLLLGRVSPAGRLPFTWPVRLTDSVANDPGHPERSSEGVKGKTQYSEGIFMGYRWFDHEHIKPLFPFGYGLSYSSFDYSHLRIARASDGGLTVSFTIHNRGRMAADEVPQVYLGAPGQAPAGAQFAVRTLAAFERIPLRPGQRRDVSLHVPMRELQYWDSGAQRWQLPGSRRAVYVGASSRDLRLTGIAAD
jgi:beta-glucosidase